MNPDKIIVIKQQKVIDELKAELTYWKEIAEHNIKAKEYWCDKYQDLLQDNEYLKRTNNDLNAERAYWKETAEHYKNEAKELEADLHYWQAYTSDLKTKHLTNRNAKCYT